MDESNIPVIHSRSSFNPLKNPKQITDDEKILAFTFLPLVFPPLFLHPLYLFISLFVTGWGSSPLLGQRSLNDSCRFCWVRSSRTWVAWRCPPRLALWRQGGPELSGCPPCLARPLWRTWTALWLYWKREKQLWEGFCVRNGEILLKPRWSSLRTNTCYSLHPLFFQTQQAVRHDVHRQVLIGQGHFKLV